ncbi:hypothetical protein CLCR_04218 [Cladophialophora carrionii]|uniref:SMODS and SLOG-associating 2TM effector domain-containing protein n=1 Tax=Cladophialophora carrionii TaxID=86049 RepID=A0A1C1CJ22_9EURO|nr:hypothetical protein CLCR_04218 [Cladophialophora carrionii]
MSLNSQSLLVDPTKTAATATHNLIDESRPSDVSGRDGDGDGVRAGAPGGPSRNMSSSSSPPASDKRQAFRQRIGIPDDGTKPPHIDLQRRSTKRKRRQPRRPSTPPDTTLAGHTLSAHIEKAYRAQTRYYFLVASASHGMLWLQIGIGATVTAIGTTNSNAARIAITVLGAINTVLAGMLTFLKSRNQPNRALQFRNGLRDVYEDLWQVDSETGRPDFDIDKKVDYLWGKYKEVIADSEANYPDLWVSLSNAGKSPSQTQKQNGSRKGSTASGTPPPPGSGHSLEVRAPLLSSTVP